MTDKMRLHLAITGTVLAACWFGFPALALWLAALLNH